MERKREEENNSNDDMQRKDECWTCKQAYEVEAKSPLAFLNKLVSNSAYLQDECESGVVKHTEGEEEPTGINKGLVPLREATSTFLNYGKSFSKRILQDRSGRNAGKRKERSQTSADFSVIK